jgi:hypothetical protein
MTARLNHGKISLLGFGFFVNKLGITNYSE